MLYSNKEAKKCPIAITCGDPAGVGPEIIKKWLATDPECKGNVCLIGPSSWLAELAPDQGCSVGSSDFVAVAGSPTVEGARVAIKALEEAAYGCRQGRYSAVVTAPVSKEWMQRAGWAYPGHTEFFADRWYGEPSMAFAGGRLCVVLATWHIPLAEVSTRLTEDCLRRAVINADFLGRALGADEPRIAVCGLNPHAGEQGLLGYEEQGIIDPALNLLRKQFPRLSACLPGDTVFWRQLQGEFDVVIALYHDQGLAPVKTVDFEAAVNITLGLPFVRTSPDHGTAFDIAGQGVASIKSFANAVNLALKLRLIK